MGLKTPFLPALIVAIAACSDETPPLDIPMEPYFEACTSEPDTCEAPYVCTTADTGLVTSDASPAADVCLVPCDSADDCSFDPSCCCRGSSCGSDVGADGFCVCV